MATLGLMASWATALFAGWALVAGLAADTPAHPMHRSAERALIASGVAALLATSALLVLLVTGDFTISYVARSITANLATPYRFAALWNLPAGAVLPTTALVAFAGWWSARKAPAPLATAAVAAVVIALCAASLAAAPFATLPWLPTEGLGLRPALQHPLSVVGAVGLSLAIAGATSRLASTAALLATAPVGGSAARDGGVSDAPAPDSDGETALILTTTVLAIAIWASARGAFVTGSASDPSPLAGEHGAMVAALCAVILAWRAARGSVAARFAGALGTVGILGALLLGALPRPGAAWTAAAFPLMSLLVAVGAAIGASVERGASFERSIGVLAALSLGAGGVAALTLPLAGFASLGPSSALPWSLIAGGMLIVANDTVGHRAQTGARRWLPAVLSAASGAVAFALSPHALVAIGWSMLAGGAIGIAVVQLTARRVAGARVALVAMATALAAIAAAGEGWAAGEATQVAGGGTTSAPASIGAPIVLAHQGISRYEDGNAHVEALALEVSRDGRSLGLVSADRREYVDSRDELLGPTIRRPAVLTMPLQELRVHLDDVASDEGATLRLAVVPAVLAWPAAAVALLLLSASLLINSRDQRSRHAPIDIDIA